jgi:hypothetical protein
LQAVPASAMALPHLSALTFPALVLHSATLPSAQAEVLVKNWIKIRFGPERLSTLGYTELISVLDGAPKDLISDLTVIWLATLGTTLEDM